MHRSLRRPASWVLAASALVALAAAATVLFALEPSARLAERNGALQASYETAAALVAGLVAYLLAGRFARTHARRDLVLAGGVTVLALSNLIFTAIPNMTGGRDDAFAVWASTLGTLMAAAALAVGSSVSNRPVGSPRRAAVAASAAVVIVIAGTALTIGALDQTLSVGIDPERAPNDAPLVSGNAVLLALNLCAGLFYALAAVGFMRRAADDELMRWFGVGAVLSAFARLNYFLLPTSLSAWLSTGDVLRMGFYVALLAGAAREIGAYQRGIAGMATAEERRRMARELHDGLAQELAYIATAGDRLASGRASPRELEMLSAASQRAMTESRMLIETLAAEPLPLGRALATAADEVASRGGIGLHVDVPADVDVPPVTCEALTRIVREAVTNAARHANADLVRVELTVRDGLRLRVVDDGCGFDPAHTDRGFGLTSMRERAKAVGAELRIVSQPGEGTEVLVAIR